MCFCFGVVWLFPFWRLWWERSVPIAKIFICFQKKQSVTRICQWDPLVHVERAAEMGFVLNTVEILYLLKQGQYNEHSSVNELDELPLRRK